MRSMMVIAEAKYSQWTARVSKRKWASGSSPGFPVKISVPAPVSSRFPVPVMTLEKVVLAAGNELVYADTYQEALAQLAGENLPAPEAATAQRPTTSPPAATTPGQPAPPPDARIAEVRRHLQRYRDLVSQGKLSDAGKELEAIQALVER